jgi:hypothetical protein
MIQRHWCGYGGKNDVSVVVMPTRKASIRELIGDMLHCVLTPRSSG